MLACFDGFSFFSNPRVRNLIIDNKFIIPSKYVFVCVYKCGEYELEKAIIYHYYQAKAIIISSSFEISVFLIAI